MSCHAANAAEMSSRAAATWKNVSREGEDSYKCMHAIVHSQMDQISGWMKLQDELNASFENATTVIRGLGEDKAKLHTERDLLREKIAGMTKQ